MHTHARSTATGLRPGSQWGVRPMGRARSGLARYAAGLFLGSAMGLAVGHGLTAQGVEGAFTNGPSVGPVASAAAPLADPVCQWDFYRHRVYVTGELGTTSARVTVRKSLPGPSRYRIPLWTLGEDGRPTFRSRRIDAPRRAVHKVEAQRNGTWHECEVT